MKFPWPPQELNPNHRAHRAKKAAIKAEYRSDCGWWAKAEISKRGKPDFTEAKIPLKIIFHPPNRIERDLDNLLAASKGMIDALADIWGVNDRRFRPLLIDFGEIEKNGAVRVSILRKEEVL